MLTVRQRQPCFNSITGGGRYLTFETSWPARLAQEGGYSMLKMAILGGLQLATTAFSEGDTGLRAALHTPEEPPSQRARSQRLWCPL